MAWDGQEKRTRPAFRALAVLPAMLALSIPHASAQTPVSGFSSLGGADSKKPIDIDSDRLEVDDKKHLAIFIGNVSATQGDNNLKAPRLEVIYESGSQAQPGAKTAQASKPVKPVKAAAPADSSDPLSSGQIKRIHALGGKVVFTNKKDQQEATGEDAVYDVPGQKVIMTGKEVVLTQKGNVIKGNKLTIDLATGQATVDNQGRIRARFTQEQGANGKPINPLAGEQKKDDAAPAKKGGTSKPAAPASGWQTQSR